MKTNDTKLLTEAYNKVYTATKIIQEQATLEMILRQIQKEVFDSFNASVDINNLIEIFSNDSQTPDQKYEDMALQFDKKGEELSDEEYNDIIDIIKFYLQ
jgi:hypothetical protein